MTISDKLLVTGAILVIPALVSAAGLGLVFESVKAKTGAAAVIVGCLGCLIASAWVA